MLESARDALGGDGDDDAAAAAADDDDDENSLDGDGDARCKKEPLRRIGEDATLSTSSILEWFLKIM